MTIIWNILFSFFQAHFLVQSWGCSCSSGILLHPKTYISIQWMNQLCSHSFSPSITTKWPAISRPSPKCNPTDSKSSVSEDLNINPSESLPLVSPLSGLPFQDHLLVITLPTQSSVPGNLKSVYTISPISITIKWPAFSRLSPNLPTWRALSEYT